MAPLYHNVITTEPLKIIGQRIWCRKITTSKSNPKIKKSLLSLLKLYCQNELLFLESLNSLLILLIRLPVYFLFRVILIEQLMKMS